MRFYVKGLKHWVMFTSPLIQRILHTMGLSQAVQVFLFFKIQDCLFILSFVDKETNLNWFRLLEDMYFLSQEVPEPPCLGIYHSSPPIPSSPGSVTTRLKVSLKYFQFSSWGLRREACTQLWKLQPQENALHGSAELHWAPSLGHPPPWLKISPTHLVCLHSIFQTKSVCIVSMKDGCSVFNVENFQIGY